MPLRSLAEAHNPLKAIHARKRNHFAFLGRVLGALHFSVEFRQGLAFLRAGFVVVLQ